MKEQIINQVLIPILGVIVSVAISLITYYVRQFYAKHKNILELQSQQLEQRIGIDKYNEDVAVVKQAVQTVEQLGKEFNWKGTLKHSKVLEMIEGKTCLTDEEIYNIIKGTVLEVNSLKSSDSNVKSNVTVQATK